MRKYWLLIVLVPLMVVAAMLAPASAKKPDPVEPRLEFAEHEFARNPDVFVTEDSSGVSETQCTATVQVVVEADRGTLSQTLRVAKHADPDDDSVSTTFDRIREATFAGIQAGLRGAEFDWVDVTYSATLTSAGYDPVTLDFEGVMKCTLAPFLSGWLQDGATAEVNDVIVSAQNYGHILVENGQAADELTVEFRYDSEVREPTRADYVPTWDHWQFVLEGIPAEVTSVQVDITNELPDTVDLGTGATAAVVPRSITVPDQHPYLDSYGLQRDGRTLRALVVAGDYGFGRALRITDEGQGLGAEVEFFCPSGCEQQILEPTGTFYDDRGDTQDFVLEGLDRKAVSEVEFRILVDVPEGAPTSVWVYPLR